MGTDLVGWAWRLACAVGVGIDADTRKRKSRLAVQAWRSLGAGLLLMALAVSSGPLLAQTAEWKPSSELTEGAEATLRDFLKAKDHGDYEAAYWMFNPGLQAMLPFATFVEQAQLFAKQSGPLTERKPIRTTWYPNAGNAQPPGTYVAFDLSARYQSIDRYCGYVILYLKPDGKFNVVRQEENYMTRDVEQAALKEKGFVAVEAAWAKISQHCPR